ncbi:2-hydroxyacid dehydrogenase [Castellaniella hirudinis]|uniref:2-hydroxyacid dehydrogenase n=1 Tax=Castellaniella hirudinis TaxID=1144617 RepID=A0ABV8RV44_9BURK
MKHKIYATNTMSARVREYLEEHFDLDVWERSEWIPKDILFEKIREVDGLFGHGVPINKELISHAGRLRIVSNMSAGYDNFNVGDMIAGGVIGTHAPGQMNETVADLVFGLMIATARRFAELDRYTRAGKWLHGDDTPLFGLDVFGKKLGIIGLGQLGETVAKRAGCFNMDVVYSSRTRKPEVENRLSIAHASLDELLATSDFIVLLVPLNQQTSRMLGKREFGLMKKTAVFINASRGGTIDEQALIEVLEKRKIHGAGLDVFDQEPVSPDNPLLKLDNTVLVPHIGSATAETRDRMAMVAAESLVSYLIRGDAINVVADMKARM